MDESPSAVIRMVKKPVKDSSTGSVVWVPAEVGPGMFPDERYINIHTGSTTVSGFVQERTVRQEGSNRTLVKAVVLEGSNPNVVGLLFSGEILTTTNPVSVPRKWLKEITRTASE
jgi:hypothetical protein